MAGQTEHGPFAGTDGTDQKQSRASSRLLLNLSPQVAQTGVGRWANSLCLRRVIERSSEFLKYDLYCVAATTAFRGATERVVDLAHSQTRRAARNRPNLGITENVARADDHPRSLTEDISGMIYSRDRDSWSCSSMALNLNR